MLQKKKRNRNVISLKRNIIFIIPTTVHIYLLNKSGIPVDNKKFNRNSTQRNT